MAVTTRVDDFHRLQSRLRLTGVLCTHTALRIGSAGGDVDGIDLPIMKHASGVPFVPGASLKGVLRSTVEALLRGAERRTHHLWACDPLEDKGPYKSCGHHEREQRAQVQLEEHCAVCRLFGSHVLASHVRFCDARLRHSSPAGADVRMPIEIRDGVSIDRDLRRARGGRKYDFEVLAPGAELDVEIFVENPRPWLMGLLAMGFDQLADGFTAIGGFSSRGLGRVSFAWSSITTVTAAGLLRNQPDVTIRGDAVTGQMRTWRDALAATYEEAA
jgi:CRISPR-associated protein Csm3